MRGKVKWEARQRGRGAGWVARCYQFVQVFRVFVRYRRRDSAQVVRRRLLIFSLFSNSRSMFALFCDESQFLSALLHSLLHRVIVLTCDRLSPKLSSPVDVTSQVALKTAWMRKKVEMTHIMNAARYARVK